MFQLFLQLYNYFLLTLNKTEKKNVFSYVFTYSSVPVFRRRVLHNGLLQVILVLDCSETAS